jgi:hypothetical protein
VNNVSEWKPSFSLLGQRHDKHNFKCYYGSAIVSASTVLMILVVASIISSALF